MTSETGQHLNDLRAAACYASLTIDYKSREAQKKVWVITGNPNHLHLAEIARGILRKYVPKLIETRIRNAAHLEKYFEQPVDLDNFRNSQVVTTDADLLELGRPEIEAMLEEHHNLAEARYEEYRKQCVAGVAVPPTAAPPPKENAPNERY